MQSKYNNIKTNWRSITDRQKNGSGLSPGKLPRWYTIINPALSDKNQGLDDIASCPAETSIINNPEIDDSDLENSGDENYDTNRQNDREDSNEGRGDST